MEVEVVIAAGASNNTHKDAEIVKIESKNCLESFYHGQKFAEYLWLNSGATFFDSLLKRMQELNSKVYDDLQFEHVKRT